MTQDEFDKTGWTGGMSCIYYGTEVSISSVNFPERLIGYATEFDDELSWARCENVVLVNDCTGE